MKRFLIAATLAAAALSASLPATAQVSVSIGQPGFYGRLDIGGFPTPALLFPEPVMIQRVPSGRPPLYLRVPPAMPGIGAGIAIVTARVASAFISFRTTGIARNTHRAIGNVMSATAMIIAAKSGVTIAARNVMKNVAIIGARNVATFVVTTGARAMAAATAMVTDATIKPITV